MTKVVELKGKNGGIELHVVLDDEDEKAMNTRDSTGHFQAVEVTPQKGSIFAKVAYIIKPSGIPGKPPIPQQVIIPINCIVIGKLHAKELRQLKEQEAKDAEIKKMNSADRERAERLKNLSPCCEGRLVHDDKDPADIFTCSKCGEEKYRRIGSVWIHADIEPSGGK